MNYDKVIELKHSFENYKEIFEAGDFETAVSILDAILKAIEEGADERRAAYIDNDLNVHISIEDGRNIYISLNHVMEYYVYACYFEPETDVCCTEIPIGEYYRTYGELCLKLSKFNGAIDAFKKAICWNPVDLDSYLGLAESYKNLNMISRYLDITKQCYRLCCTRATMARYYRNMGFYYISQYNTDMACACYQYSNIYYHTENADNELKYIKEAVNTDRQYTISQMQEMFDKEGVEPGPDSMTIGIIYRVGELMMQDNAFALARDCFSIVYDITREEKLRVLLDELEKVVEEPEERT